MKWGHCLRPCHAGDWTHTHTHTPFIVTHLPTQASGQPMSISADPGVGTCWISANYILEAFWWLIRLWPAPAETHHTGSTCLTPYLHPHPKPHHSQAMHAFRYLQRRCRIRWVRTWPPPPDGRAPCRCRQGLGSAGRRAGVNRAMQKPSDCFPLSEITD